MPQMVLDPRDEAIRGTWKPEGALPRRVLKFGRYPNVGDWLPGDLILFESAKRLAIVAHLISWAQRASYHQDHARWYHAAVYVGEGYLCEATILRGVRYQPVAKYVSRHRVRVRRDPTLDEAQRFRIAIRSLTRLRESYGFLLIVELTLRALKGFWHPGKLALGTRGVICSKLYEWAYRGATGRIVLDARDREILPADLSLTDKLEDVPVHWLAISRH